MAAREDWLIPYRLRTVRIGLWATLFVLGALVPFTFLPGHPRLDETPFLITLAVAAGGALVFAALPWRRLFGGRWGMRVMYAWSVADILLISLLILFGGHASGELFLLYAFTVVFAAASYPRPGQLALLLLSFASYLSVEAFRGWTIQPADLVLRLGLLIGLAYMADFLSRELRSGMLANYRAQQESERRSTLLATVAEAGRRMSDLDSARVLETVVDSALALGFESGNFALYDDELASYVVVHARGLPVEYSAAIHSADIGMPALVREQRRTVLVDDYLRHPKAVPMLRKHHYRAVIASPIWVRGRLTAALVAGTKQHRDFTHDDVEAFELLASFASRAIENAQRFEHERQAVERLGELDRLKSEFISTVSHELRTPLTTILGMGLTLERQWDRLDEDMRREFLSRLNANASTLSEIVQTLLDVSRFDAGRTDVKKEAVRLDQIVRSVVVRVRSLLKEHRVRLDLDEVEAAGDPALLERVVENLLHNAAKHTPAETAIRVSTRVDDGAAVVEISDAGPGIAVDDLAHIGERFFRGGEANTRSTRGTGLGLALVKEMLDLHGSTLEIRSEIGTGSTFSFRLPLWVAAKPPASKPVRRPA